MAIMRPSDPVPPKTGVDRRALIFGGTVAGIGMVAGAAPALGRNLPDVAVIGAGAFGGWTALSLREQGARVTLIDAYGAGNPRASSGDESRLLRLSYGKREIYTRWAARAAGLWDERQREFGRQLYYPNGSLRVMASAEMAAQRAVFDKLGIGYDVLSPDEVRHRWPQVNYDDAEAIFYEPTGGVVKARESMIAVAEAFARKGGKVMIGHVELHPSLLNNAPIVTIDKRPLVAGAYVFACGPWLPKVMPALLGDRIRVPRREIFYIGSPIDDHRYRWEHLPNLADMDTYTAFDIDYGIKIAAKLTDIAMDPDDGTRLPTAFLASQIQAYVAKRMPGLVGQPIVATRICQTEYTDNSDFIIDRHPDHANIWIAGGGSGHGFKMGPALGVYISGRVLGHSSDPDEAALFSLAKHGPAAKLA
jgi:sarcosine oxidase